MSKSSERPRLSNCNPGSWRIPDHDGFQCKSHSRFKKAGAPIEPIRISPVLLRPSLLLLAANASPSLMPLCSISIFAVEEDGQSLLRKQRTSSVPKRRPGGSTAKLQEDEIFMPDPLESGRNYKRCRFYLKRPS